MVTEQNFINLLANWKMCVCKGMGWERERVRFRAQSKETKGKMAKSG